MALISGFTHTVVEVQYSTIEEYVTYYLDKSEINDSYANFGNYIWYIDKACTIPVSSFSSWQALYDAGCMIEFEEEKFFGVVYYGIEEPKPKKFLDINGVQQLYKHLSLSDYPNNETLVAILNAIDETKANKEEIPLKVSQLENDSKFATEEQVEDLYNRLNSNATLGFYCVEDVTIVLNGVSTTYPANSNVEIKMLDTDVWEIIPTSDNSILQLNAFPGALGTYYSWLEGVKQFSNILFDMNNVDFYSKWSQGNQGAYQVQYAQYINCIFWSDNPYVSDVSKRTNYTLYYTSQLPLCYSSIPDNTFKSFYLAFNVNSDPNWGNKVYRDSFAKATWATQVFSYYGARTIGIFGHDDPDFNITLPKDCRGLMYQSTAIENAGTFDAINTTNFGATGSSWQQAFGQCSSLRNLYIKNLTVNLNVSWSPLNYQSIYFIISKAANTKAITISVSPYTYNLLGPADFELATSKNITIKLVTTNYVEDKRFTTVAYTTGDGEFTGDVIAGGNGGSVPVSLKTVNNILQNKADSNTVLLKTEQTFTEEELAQIRTNLGFANSSNAELEGSLGLNHTGELGFTSVSLGFANEASGMYCFAEGMGNKSTGDASHSEGTGNTASGMASHAEGYGVLASNVGAHAEGANTVASGYGSHAEGSNTIASIEGQHVEGKYNIDDPSSIHVVGNGTSNTKRSNAHTLNLNGEAWFAGDVYVGSTSGTNKDEGSKKLATEEYVDSKSIDPVIIENKKDRDLIVTYAEGSTFGVTHSTEEIYEAIQNGTTVYFQKDTELLNLMEITPNYATFFMFYMNMEGKPQQKVVVISDSSIMLDQDDTYNYAASNTVLLKTAQTLTDAELTQVRSNLKFIGEDLKGKTFTIDGQTYTASPNAERFGDYINNIAIGQWSIAEGSGTVAKGRASHAEGAYSRALNDGCHVEGYQTEATGYWSHAEGEMTKVTSYASHAEGSYCTLPNGTKRYGTASGYASHIEGGGCHATGSCSHAEGLATTVSGAQAHAEGRYTIAAGGAQHVEGIANIEDAEGKYIHIAGNGAFDNRSNAYTLDWDGNAWFSGDVYVGSTSGLNKDDGSAKLATTNELSTNLREANLYTDTQVSALLERIVELENKYTALLEQINAGGSVNE